MNPLQDKRLWLGGAGLAALLIVVIAWVAVISPPLSSASALQDEALALQDQNTILQAKTAALEKQKQSLGVLTASLRSSLAALPPDSGLPAFTRQVAGQALRSSVTLTSITVGGIGPLAALVPTTPAAAADGATAETPAAAGTTKPAAGGLFTIRVTLITTGTAPRQIAFLTAVQATGPRRALVMSTQLVPGSGSGTMTTTATSTMTTELTVFSAPQSPQARAQLDKLLRGNVTG